MSADIGSYLSSPSNRAKVFELFGEHVVLAVLPLLIGLAVAVPLGWAAQRVRWLRAPVLGSASVLYTVPSLALFVIMPSILGTRILDGTNVVVALALYTSALLVRPVADALGAVP
ncbi:MAG: ABC transporter permease, partial [Pseudonocardiaceae bacterium]